MLFCCTIATILLLLAAVLCCFWWSAYVPWDWMCSAINFCCYISILLQKQQKFVVEYIMGWDVMFASTNLCVVMLNFWIAGCVRIWMKTRDDVSVC